MKKEILLMVLLSIAGFFLILVLTSKYGIGFSSDSLFFVSASKSLLAGDGYLKYTGAYYIKWPPLYPTIVAISSLGLFSVVTVMRYLGAVLFGATIFFSGFLAYKILHTKILSVLSSLFILLSFPLIRVFFYAWTEPLFILLVLLFFIALIEFVRNNNVSFLVLTGFFFSMATLTRYIGVILIIPAVIAILVLADHFKFKKRLLYSVLFTFFSFLPLGIWVLRNYLLSDTLTGFRLPSTFPLSLNLYRFFDNTEGWLFLSTDFFGRSLRILFIRAVVFIFLPAVFLIFVKKCKRLGKNYFKSLTLIYSFVIFYSISLVASASLVAIDPVGYKFLSPIYPFFFLFITFVIDFGASILKGTFPKVIAHRVFITLSIVFVLFWGINAGKVLNAEVRKAMKEGVGNFNKLRYNEKYSSLIEFMKRDYSGEKIYSNNLRVFYALTGLTVKGCNFIQDTESSFYLVVFKDKAVPSRVWNLLEHYDMRRSVTFNYAHVYKYEKK